MAHEDVCGLILAAGKGTRMHSDTPKVLKTLLGEPMLWYVHAAVDRVLPGRSLTVVGHGAEAVARAFPDRAQRFVMQERQLGTGHALQTAWPALNAAGAACCLVVNGDTPLLHADTLAWFLDACAADAADLAFLSITPAAENAFGRVIRAGDGRVAAIVEKKDFDPARFGPATGEVNAGIYFLRMAAVEPLLSRLTDDNAGGEFYITDLIGLAVAAGLRVSAFNRGDDLGLMGVNSPAELVRAEDGLRQALVRGWLDRGVLIRHPGTCILGPRVELAPGAELHGHVEAYGASRIEAGASVGPFVWMRDAVVGPGSEVRPFSHLEGAVVGRGCQVGPYARLRPGAVLEESARVGNFVEMKKAVLKRGAKANHLTYLGDAEVGEGANIGAGTITCNYDGKNKFRTVIGAKAFIGSNTALVAPVTVGEGALVGAGSTITKDVPDGELGIGRTRQVNLRRRAKNSS